MQTLTRRQLFSRIGMALALGAPSGLLLLRAVMGWEFPGVRFILQELARDPALYAYATLSTIAVFWMVGYCLGKAADRLEKGALTDPLTGLPNRRNFDAKLEAEFSRAMRYGTPVSVIVLDMDGLKAVNDKFGHQAGDKALKLIAASIINSCRTTDLPARLGGDEFGVLAAGVDAQSAFTLAERLRSELAELSQKLNTGAITVSLGIAEATPAMANSAELLDEADKALYQSKQSGRNRTSIRTQPSTDMASGVSGMRLVTRAALTRPVPPVAPVPQGAGGRTYRS